VIDKDALSAVERAFAGLGAEPARRTLMDVAWDQNLDAAASL
jgi:hypothetical protein